MKPGADEVSGGSEEVKNKTKRMIRRYGSKEDTEAAEQRKPTTTTAYNKNKSSNEWKKSRRKEEKHNDFEFVRKIVSFTQYKSAYGRKCQ